MRLEKLEESNLKECSNIYIDTFNEEPWNDNWNEETAYKRLKEIFKTPGFLGLVAIEEDEIIGAVLGNLETWFEGYMYNLKELFVMKDRKGKKIGSFLFEGLEKELTKNNVTSLSLFTIKGDLTETFYKRHGCKIDEEIIMMEKNY